MTTDSLFTRSLMFVPGSKQRMIEKSIGLHDLDIAMYDIEDGVTPSEKPLARAQIAALLATTRDPRSPARFVRINAVGSGRDRIDADLERVVVPGLEGIVVPKVDTAEQLRLVSGFLDREEVKRGISPGSVRLIVAIESAVSLLNAAEIAGTSARLVGMIFGAEDYALDLGLPADREAEARELIWARSSFANAAASAHIGAFDGVWPDIHDADGVRRDAIQARRLGMTGKSTFHPGQIAIINEAFAPTDAEIARAGLIVLAFEEGQARGDGAVAFGGQLLDLPIVERARRSLRMHETLRVRAAATS